MMSKISELCNVPNDPARAFSPPSLCEQGVNICAKNLEKNKKLEETGAALATASSGQEACAQDLPGMTKSFSINTHLNAGMQEGYAKSTPWQTRSQMCSSRNNPIGKREVKCVKTL